MTREEAARRYLEASRAASILPRGSEGQAVHHDTMRRLEHRHPDVKMHATVGTSQDFDQPLHRNDREHQAELRRRSGLTNQQITARRRELRANHYGFPNPAEIYDAANPAHDGARRRRRPASSSRRARSATRLPTPSAPGPVKQAGSIAWELLMAGFALSLLYLLLTSEEKGGTKVFSTVLTGVSGAFNRLLSPTNDLFSPATVKRTTAPATPSRPRVGVSSPAALKAYQRETAGVFSSTLPNYSSVTPTIP